MTQPPLLTQFRVEIAPSGVVHLVFDCPERTMNVFSDAAIVELGTFARWLPDADVRGVVIRSGKANAFCAGADLTELGVAYDMIVAAPERRRFDLAFDHFFRLSTALRALETAGKPVAAAIAGLALGGGCELALAAHHRVLVDDAKVAMGLPESLVGLLPGAGGTQRLPRLIGIDAALPILLDGARLSGAAAKDAGLVNQLVPLGDEVAAAEAWVLDVQGAAQPWDGDDWQPAGAAAVAAAIAPVRARVLADTQGHYPAPLAILDCVEFGLPQLFDGAIRSEMAIFAHLIQREEPRNMIQTLFTAKTEYDRLERRGALPPSISSVVAAARDAVGREDADVLTAAGFPGDRPRARDQARRDLWIDGDAGIAARAALARIGEAVEIGGAMLTESERCLADYAIVSRVGYPGYLGGPFSFAKRSGSARRPQS